MEEALNRIWDFINWIFQYIGGAFTDIFSFFNHLTDIIESIVSFLLWILWFVWYAWKTLITWVYKLLYRIFDWWVFINVNKAFIQISEYIWWPATVFLSAILLLVITRIVIAFVFKIFRRDLDYNALQRKKKAISIDQAIEDMKWRWFFDS